MGGDEASGHLLRVGEGPVEPAVIGIRGRAIGKSVHFRGPWGGIRVLWRGLYSLRFDDREGSNRGGHGADQENEATLKQLSFFQRLKEKRGKTHANTHSMYEYSIDGPVVRPTAAFLFC